MNILMLTHREPLNTLDANKKPVNIKPVIKNPVNKGAAYGNYTNSELFQALKQDEIEVTEQDIQKEKENDPETLYKIGDAYYKKEKYEKAFPWFHKAALRDHSDAQAQVGDMYHWGEGVSQDYKQTMDWNMKAASVGNARGQYNIGELYYLGRGVPEDNKQAMDWFLKAANNGNIKAMNEIGWMYRYGEGVTENIPTAIEWYTKATNQGHAGAQYYLGDIYRDEDEVKDLQLSVNWYQKAADNGHLYAKEEVERLNKQGYYAKEDIQKANILVEEKAQDKTINDNDAINNITNDQNQSFTTSNNNVENANKLIDDKLKEMEKAFQLKMNLIQQQYEGNSDALQKELASLKQKELDQKEENRLLKERMARMEAGIQDNADTDLNRGSPNDKKDDENDINYDSECSNNEEESDNINDKAKMNVTEGKNVSLQNDSTTLKQENHHQYEENQLLKERLAGIQDDANDDPYYSSSDNNDNNDINYDSECSINEEAGDDCNTTAKQNRTEGNDDALQKELAALKQKELEQYEENQRLKERRARMEEAMQSNGDNDLNYDSSDNEHNDNSATNNIGVKKKDDHALEKERAALKQKELEQHKENQLLRERLARIVAVQDDPHNDPYYNLSDNEEDDKNDITYNTKRRNADKKKGENNTTTNTQQRERHYHSVEIYADPNYDSSDNEDPRNDIYLD